MDETEVDIKNIDDCRNICLHHKIFCGQLSTLLPMTHITLMGTNVRGLGTVGNRNDGSVEAQVRGGVDPPTWPAGTKGRQGRVRERTPRTGGQVRVG